MFCYVVEPGKGYVPTQKAKILGPNGLNVG